MNAAEVNGTFRSYFDGTFYDDFNFLITDVCIVASFGSVWLVFRYLDKITDEEVFTSPSLSTFDGK